MDVDMKDIVARAEACDDDQPAFSGAEMLAVIEHMTGEALVCDARLKISGLRFADAQVVVARVNRSFCYSSAGRLLTLLRRAVPEGCPILVISDDVDVSALDAAAMRELGWVRADPGTQHSRFKH